MNTRLVKEELEKLGSEVEFAKTWIFPVESENNTTFAKEELQRQIKQIMARVNFIYELTHA